MIDRRRLCDSASVMNRDMDQNKSLLSECLGVFRAAHGPGIVTGVRCCSALIVGLRMRHGANGATRANDRWLAGGWDRASSDDDGE
jgi:hypothetical protein